MAQEEKRELRDIEEQAKFELFLSRPEVYESIFGRSKEQAEEDDMFAGAEEFIPQSAAEVEEILAQFRAQEEARA